MAVTPRLDSYTKSRLKYLVVSGKPRTPFASIRRIVQTHEEFFKIRPGLWALTSEKERIMSLFVEQSGREKQKEYSHYFFQGLVVEIGNFKGFKTHIPNITTQG